MFTVVTKRREPILITTKGWMLLGGVMRECLQRWPFEILGIILLPDHLHAIFRLPKSDSAYPKRCGWIKKAR